MEGSLLSIDESRLFREGLRGILSNSPFQIKHETSSVEEFIEQRERFADVQPDLVLFDGRGDDKTLAGQFECLSRIPPQARIVFPPNPVRIIRLALAFPAGVDGYLPKDVSANALRESPGLVPVGEKVFSSSLAALLIDSYLGHRDKEPMNDSAAGALSRRQRQILGCLVLGHPNKTIANQLGITESTVKGLLKGLLTKIKASNRGHRRPSGRSRRAARVSSRTRRTQATGLRRTTLNGGARIVVCCRSSACRVVERNRHGHGIHGGLRMGCP